MKYLDKYNIKELNIEHTSYCNLLCPECARVVKNKLNPKLKLKSMKLEDYRRIINSFFLKNIEHIFFCGNYGDAIADKNFLDCVKFLKIYNIKISIYTNGSLRSKNWWKELSFVLTDKDKVIFSIDGLHDTNHLYRVNSNFNKIMENAKTFIENGGNATWDYLIFEHNNHQVEDAKQLALDMGFKKFNEKKTKRYIAYEDYKTSKDRDDEFENVLKKYNSLEEYTNKTQIICKYQTRNIMYIDYNLNLWPCCWMGSPLEKLNNDNKQKKQLIQLYKTYRKGFNSLKNQSIEEVLEHPWFKNDLVESWDKTVDENKFIICGRTCGTEYDFSSGYDSNKNKINLEEII